MKRYLVNLALFAATLLVGFGLGECTVRVAVPEMAGLVTDRGSWTHDPHVGWVGRPNLDVLTRVGDMRIRVRTNDDGFRDEPFVREKTPGRVRIVLFGDSMTYGLGVEEKDRLDERIESRVENVEVWSTGISAYATDQELLTFRRLAPELDPDIVGVVFVPNDPRSNAGAYGHGYPKPHFVKVDGKLELKNVPVPLPSRVLRFKYWLQRHCALCNFIRIAGSAAMPKITDEGLVGKGQAPPGEDDAGWKLTLELLELFEKEATARGARFFVVVSTSHVELFEGDHPLNVKLLEWCRARDVPCVETFAPLLAYEHANPTHRLFLPDGHWDVDGHRVVGDAIYDSLRKWKWIGTTTTAASIR